MSTISFSFSKTNGQSFTETDIQTVITELETYFNTTGVDGSNIINGSLIPASINASEWFADDSLTLTNDLITVGTVPDTAFTDDGIISPDIGIGSLSRSKLAEYVEVTAGSAVSSQEYFIETHVSGTSTAVDATFNSWMTAVSVQPLSIGTGAFDRDTATFQTDASTSGGFSLAQNDARMPQLFIDFENQATGSGAPTGSPSTVAYSITGNAFESTDVIIIDGGL